MWASGITKTFTGSELVGTICSHPFLKMNYNYDVPMLDGQFVNLDQGTGIVHCAPSHGADDFNLCLKIFIAVETSSNWAVPVDK